MTTDAWGGEAGSAWRVRAGEIAPHLDADAGLFSDVEAAIATYITASEGIIERAVAPRQRLDAAEQELRRLYWNSDYIGRNNHYCPHPDLIPELRAQAITDAETDQETARNELRELKAERDTAAGLLCTALRAGEPDNWHDVYMALLRAGVTSSDQLTVAGVAELLADLSRRIGSGQYTSEDVEDLNVLLGVYGDDHTAMAMYFLNLGGTDTVSLVDALGDGALPSGEIDPALALATGLLVRGGLSLGSSRWSPATASNFADEMLENASSTVGGRVSAIGWLFSDVDGAPMGEELTVATADLIDRHERDPMAFYPGAWSDTSVWPSGAHLAMLEGADPRRVNDLGARVMQTLGSYPDAALDWLTDTSADHEQYGQSYSGLSLGDARVEYWFGQRDSSVWTTGDGYEGVSALWEGAMRADGGLLAGAHDHDQMVRIATLSSTIFEQLSANEWMTTEAMSEAGTIALADAIGVQLSQLDEFPITAQDSGNPAFRDDRSVLGYGIFPTVHASEGDLSDLLALVSGSEGGREALSHQVAYYVGDLLIAASDPASGITADAALERIAQVTGSVDGALFANEMIVGRNADENAAAAVDLVMNFVPSVPGGYPVGVAQNVILGGAADFALDNWWATNYEEAISANEQNEDARLAAQEQTLGGLIDYFVENGLMEEPEDRALYLGGLVDSYDNQYHASSQHAEQEQR